MKTIFTILFPLLFLSCHAQNCKLTKDETDEFSGKLKRITKETTVSSYNLVNLKAMLLRVDSEYTLIFYFNKDTGLGCATNKSRIIMKFDSGETLELLHNGKIDCGAPVMMSVNITDHLDKLRDANVPRIRYILESYQDLDVRSPRIFSDLIHCVR